MSKAKMVIIPLVAVVVAAAAGGGYYLWHQKKTEVAKKAGEEKPAQGPLLYTCSMHPFIVKDKPGACPICGMTLVKKIEPAQEEVKQPQAVQQVSISPTQQMLANVATVEAVVKPLAREVSATGIVTYDQSRQAKVTAWVAGRIDRLYVNTVGAVVSKGKPVAELYSPDLVSAQQEYLLALRSRDQLKNSSIRSISQGGEGLVASARQRLLLMGVKEHQIAELERAGQPNIKLPVYTPLSGVVIEKMALDGQYVNMGDPLFVIADLSSVWVELEVYESDIALARVGQRVEVTSQAWPGKTFAGRVSFVYPFLDPKTRTVKVRVDIPNPGLRLKPDMFVSALVKAPLGSAVAVPVTAVMDTGRHQMVWVETKPGVFEPREVKVGARAGDDVQILAGLRKGEKVAASGGYLIDSESQLKGGGSHEGHGGMPGMKMEEKKGGGLDMGDMKM